MGKRILTTVLVTILFILGCDVGSDDDKNPTILEVLPADLTVDVSVNAEISITFSEAMDKDKAQTAFSIKPEFSGDPNFNWSGNTMKVTFDKDLITHTVYTCTINKEAKTLKKKSLKKEFHWTFVTEPGQGVVGQIDQRLDKTTNGCASLFIDDACSGNNVYFVWPDTRSGFSDIYLNYSHDGGETWATNDVKLNTNPSSASDCSFARIACSGDKVYVSWSDNRNGNNDVYFNYSHDAGETWLDQDFRLDKDAAGNASSSTARIACSGDNVYVVWSDDRNGLNTDIYLNYSNDGGVTWQDQDIRMNTNGASASGSSNQKITACGSNVYVMWTDDRNGQADIYMNISHDYGQTWLESDIRIDKDVAGASQNWRPEIACSDNNVLVVWTDYRNGDQDVYANFSNDCGETWQANDIRIDSDTTNATIFWPYLDVSGDNFYIVWNDLRNGEYDIYFNCSNDAGKTWLAHDVRLDTDAVPGQYRSDRASVQASGQAVFVSWNDNRNGYFDVYVNYSLDGGKNWLANDIRMDTDTPGVTDSVRPQMCCSGANAFVAWRDSRDGASVYFNSIK